MKTSLIVLIVCLAIYKGNCTQETWQTRNSDQGSADYDSQWNSRSQPSEVRSNQGDSSNNNNNNWGNAAPYFQKIMARLDRSEVLATNPEMKAKLMKMADDKLKSCNLPYEGNVVDRHCVGHITGQMMQLIAAYEQVNRSQATGL